eukprot:c8925_g1_i2.p1 GENE.c8925_g1_i2~~c8925_g1_i2.p1  ORF type:complete len:187 (+),score=25.24 c8925_g1_i2:498-1058(+)
MHSHNHLRVAVRLREMELTDVKQVEELHLVLFPVRYPASFFEKLCSSPIISVVALIEGEIVGVATARLATDENCGTDGYIMTFGVHPKHQRSGVGSKLLLEICRLIQLRYGSTHAHLHVKADNTTAISFYTKHKFHVRSICRDHYFIDSRFHDALWLVLDLPQPIAPASASLFSGLTKYLCNCFSN